MFNPVSNNPVHDVWEQQELPEYDTYTVEVPLKELITGEVLRLKNKITKLNRELKEVQRLKASYLVTLKEL